MSSADVGDGGHGDGQRTVRGVDGALPLSERRDDGVGDAEVVEAPGCRSDVDDRIDRSDLVEVNLLGRGSMRLRLRIGEDGEGAGGYGLGACGQLGAIDDGEALRQAAMLMVMMVVMVVIVVMVVMIVVVIVGGTTLRGVSPMGTMSLVGIEPCHIVVVVLVIMVEHHIEIAGSERTRHLARDADLVALERKGRERGTEPLAVGAEVEQGGHQHVAGDAGRALEVERLRHGRSFQLLTRAWSMSAA